MTKSLTNAFTLFLALVGVLVASILTKEHFFTSSTGCFASGEGCAGTINSSYGHVGPVPTAILGLGMYLALALLCFVRGRGLRVQRERVSQGASAYAGSVAMNDAAGDGTLPDVGAPAVTATAQPEAAATGITLHRLDMAVWGIALSGFGISMWLQYVAIYGLHSFCKYCFTSAILITLIFALASRDYLLDGRKLNGEQKMIGAVLGFIAVMGSFIVIPQIIEVANTRKAPVAEPVKQSDLTRNIVVTPTMHIKGDPTAPHTLIEFADYECGHCAKAAPLMETVLKHYPKQVKIAFRSFPLPNHKWARQAAQASEAADLQGKYWEMHDLLFKHQEDMDSPAFTDADFDKIAGQLKLDIKKFDADRLSDTVIKRVEVDMRAGEQAGVESTPTFFFVAPSTVTKFAGIEEMEKFMKNSDSPAWK